MAVSPKSSKLPTSKRRYFLHHNPRLCFFLNACLSNVKQQVGFETQPLPSESPIICTRITLNITLHVDTLFRLTVSCPVHHTYRYSITSVELIKPHLYGYRPPLGVEIEYRYCK